MASSGSFQTSGYTVSDGNRTLEFVWSEISQSIENNTTTISWTLRGGGTSGQYVATRAIKLTINGETVYSYPGSSTKYINLDLGTLVANGTYTFTHKDDGTQSFTVYAEAGIYEWSVNCTGSKTFTLDTIARASQPSLVTWPETTNNVGAFGETFSIHMNRKASTLTHTVRYEYGSRKGTIATNVGTGTTWAVPLEFMNDIPAATSASGRIYVDTYSGSTLVGTKYTGFTVTVPASVKPTVTATLDDITGIDGIYGSPVKGLSKIKITPSVTLAYSSPIASYTITANGVTYNTSPATTGLLTASGSSVVAVTVRDKRGRTGSWSYTMSVKDYSSPAISKLTVHRCDADGSENDQGAYCKATFSVAVSQMAVNAGGSTVSLKVKKSTDADSAYSQKFSQTNAVTLTNKEVIFAADDNTSYDVMLTVSDSHHSTVRTTSVSTAFTLINWHESGRGIAFGKVSEKDGTVEIAMDVEFTGKLTGAIFDAILPVGSMVLRYDHINPGTLYPGTTWVRVEGAFPWLTGATGQIGLTGGEREHTLTTAEMPAHSHGSVYSQHASGTKQYAWYTASGSAVAYGAVSAGGGEAHNNMPPYIQVSAWRRTA